MCAAPRVRRTSSHVIARRLIAAFAVAGLLAGCSAGSHPTPARPATSSPQPSSVAAAAPSLRRYYRQRLTWHPCDSSLQCATLTVPVDYATPAGATLQIAVIRKPASGTRRGSLVVNPGGPGASGVQFVEQASAGFAQLTDHYDLVSFDPRGVGGSRPVRCVSSGQLDALVAADPAPSGPAGLASAVRRSRAFAIDCNRRQGRYLSEISTIDEARDMDVLRSALGDAKLTYFGGSYGTYLGAQYVRLFPTHIRAMVLDGAFDPALSTFALAAGQARGFEADLNDFLAACAATQHCPLGPTDSAALARLRDFMSELRSRPVPVGDRHLTTGTFFEGLLAGLYSPSSWSALQSAVAAAYDGNGQGMLALSDALSGRRADGSYSNLIEANYAINCIDRPSPRRVADYVTAANRLAKVAPMFGPAVIYGDLPCAFWSVPPVATPAPLDVRGAPPILVIGTTGDPATPYSWARALTRQLRSAVLLTFVGDGHTAYLRANPCVLTAVHNYVEDLDVPKPGTTCRTG